MTLSLFSDWRGRTIPGRDGPAGRVFDVYFDDETWRVRYVVIDVGRRLRPDRRLVVPSALSVTASQDSALVLAASSENIRISPSTEFDRPVSVQKLEERHRYSELLFYRDTGLTTSGEAPSSIEGLRSTGRPGDVHLRSCRTVVGYGLAAPDGLAGKVCDFLIDVESWVIRFVAVRPHRYSRRPRALSATLVTHIDWESSRVGTEAPRSAVLSAPPVTRYRPVVTP